KINAECYRARYREEGNGIQHFEDMDKRKFGYPPLGKMAGLKENRLIVYDEKLSICHFSGVDCRYMETRLQDTERRMMAALELVNQRVSYQVEVCTRESLEFCMRHHDAQKDRAAMRAEIEVLRNERLAYEQEAEIPEADTPPRKRLLLAAPRHGCEVGESSAAAAARQPGPTTTRSEDREDVRAKIEVLRRERLAYEKESI
nr:hypothetical protein [Tanacetum cinerariifolium]